MDTSIGVVSLGLKVDQSQNCGMLSYAWRGWKDFICEISPFHPMNCGCEHPEQMYLQLRGLCPQSNIDTIYVPRNKEAAVLLLGLETSIIEYDKVEMAWSLTEHKHNTTAVTDAALETYALGSHEWLIENDQFKCSIKGKPYRKVLKLTGCREGEFTCSNGQCIKMEERCDQIIHCNDDSDEENCYLLVFKKEETYNNNVPPFSIDPIDNSVIPVKVIVSTSLLSVLAISEFSHTIDLKLGITLEWYENRVFYHNLKAEEALNTLTKSEVDNSSFAKCKMTVQ